MKITNQAQLLIVRDSLVGVWVFYAMFMLGGAVAIACPLGLCAETAPFSEAKDYIAIAAGLAAFMAGAALICKTPFTTAVFDREQGTAIIRQWGFCTKAPIRLRLADIHEPVILQREGTEGTGYQLNLRMKDGRTIALSAFWAANKASIDQAAGAIRAMLGEGRF